MGGVANVLVAPCCDLVTSAMYRVDATIAFAYKDLCTRTIISIALFDILGWGSGLFLSLINYFFFKIFSLLILKPLVYPFHGSCFLNF